MTGVGINLKEVPDENGNFRLEVLGIILDGPAHSAGVRQVDRVDGHSSKFVNLQIIICTFKNLHRQRLSLLLCFFVNEINMLH